MLSRLTRGIALRAALALAALAVLGASVPPIALAFTDADVAAICIVGGHKAMGADHGQHRTAVHVRPDASPVLAADHGLNGPSPTETTACCGLFCFTFLMPLFPDHRERLALGTKLTPSASPDLFSRVPDCPDRPPRTSLTI